MGLFLGFVFCSIDLCVCFYASTMLFLLLYYLAVRKKKILPFATVWMVLDNIMLSEISQSEKDKYHMILLICGI